MNPSTKWMENLSNCRKYFQIIYLTSGQHSSIQFSLLVISNSLQPRRCSTSGFRAHHQLLEFVQTHVHWVSDAIQPSHPLSPSSPPALKLSQHQPFPTSQLFASGGHSIGASASAPVLPMNIQGWLPLGLTGFDLPAVQGIFKSLLQHHSSKASILQHSDFLMVQFSHTWLLEKP